MALPIPPLAQCFLLHPLKPLSCTSKRCIGLQPDLFFQQIHSSGHTGRVLIRLLSSPWVSFDLDYNLPKKRLHVQPWVNEQTLTPLALQPPAMVPTHHQHHSLDPTPSHSHGAGLQPSWQSKWCEGGQPQHFCWSPPLFMQIQKCSNMQISGKRLHHYLCAACRHEELLFCSRPGTANDIPLPPGSLLGGRQDHVLFRLCEMQLEAPPQPAGASVKRSEGKKKDLPAVQQCVDFEVLGHLLSPPEGL